MSNVRPKHHNANTPMSKYFIMTAPWHLASWFSDIIKCYVWSLQFYGWYKPRCWMRFLNLLFMDRPSFSHSRGTQHPILGHPSVVLSRVICPCMECGSSSRSSYVSVTFIAHTFNYFQRKNCGWRIQGTFVFLIRQIHTTIFGTTMYFQYTIVLTTIVLHVSSFYNSSSGTFFMNSR
jgi:hypothetical protein